MGQGSRSPEENVAEVIGVTLVRAFQYTFVKLFELIDVLIPEGV